MGRVVAFHAAQRITEGEALDVGGWQRQRFGLGLRVQHIAAAVLADGLQTRATEQMAQGLISRVITLYAWRLAAQGKFGGGREGDPCLARELIEGVAQWPRSDFVVATGAGNAVIGRLTERRQRTDPQHGGEQGGTNGVAQQATGRGVGDAGKGRRAGGANSHHGFPLESLKAD
ncbi:hypothetical protein D3C78_628010 [compost metagenome]